MPRRTPYTLSDFYALGQEIKEAYDAWPERGKDGRRLGLTRDFQKKRKSSIDLLEKARRLAAAYTKDEIDELAKLEGPSHKRLGHWHLIHLLPVRDRRTRMRLARAAAEEEWSVARLRWIVREGVPKESLGGRPTMRATDVNTALSQLEDLTNRLLSWYQAMEDDVEEGAGLAELPPKVRKKLKELQGPLTEVRDAAESQLSTGPRKVARKTKPTTRTKAGTEKKRTSRSPSKGRKPAKRKR